MEKREDESFKLDYEDILYYLKNRPPLLMIDSAVVVPGQAACTCKYLKEDEWYFPCHFPGNPLMPGVLQLETVFQTAALAIKTIEGNREKTTNISRIISAAYYRPVLPDTNIEIRTKVLKYSHGIAKMEGEIRSEDILLCNVEFILAIPEDMVLREKS